MDYLDYWGLEDAPFEEDGNPKFFYESIDHQEALERLRYVIESTNMNMGLLTGEIGAGKTMTRNVLIQELLSEDDPNFVVTLDTSAFRYIDILKEILCQLLNVDPERLPSNKYSLIKRIKSFLETEVVPMNKQVYIFLDEAQRIAQKYLDSLKDLTNIKYDYKSPITLIFIGQPNLLKNIIELPQVYQRIGMRYHLNHMTKKDTFNYIRHRLAKAGLDKEIFTQDAYNLIYSKTIGVPREINRACKIALDFGFTEEMEMIDKKTMSIIFCDFYRYDRRKVGTEIVGIERR
ncbi:MAG: hypothetical protein DRZ79_02590 [Candidatus Cloacimonadota bacterium]|nr:MAG: hypothetical protein DRZ79_02590 [Candidatus Cloacimonadota bacterium]